MLQAPAHGKTRSNSKRHDLYTCTMYIGVSLNVKTIERGNCGTLTFNEIDEKYQLRDL